MEKSDKLCMSFHLPIYSILLGATLTANSKSLHFFNRRLDNDRMLDSMHIVGPYFPRELAEKNDPLKFDFTKRLYDLPYTFTYNLRDDSLIEGGLVIKTYSEMLTLFEMLLADNENNRPEAPLDSCKPAKLDKWDVFLRSGKFTLLVFQNSTRWCIL